MARYGVTLSNYNLTIPYIGITENRQISHPSFFDKDNFKIFSINTYLFRVFTSPRDDKFIWIESCEVLSISMLFREKKVIINF